MAVDVVTIDAGLDFGHMEIRILGAFAPFENHRGRDELDTVLVRLEVRLDLRTELGLSAIERFVDYDQRFWEVAIFAAKHVFQQRVLGAKDISREEDPLLETDPNGPLNHRHHHS